MMAWKQKLGKSSWYILDKNNYAFICQSIRMRLSSSSWRVLRGVHARYRYNIAGLIMLESAIILALPAVPLAGGLTSSTNYELGEAFFGTGGQLNSCSSNYC